MQASQIAGRGRHLDLRHAADTSSPRRHPLRRSQCRLHRSCRRLWPPLRRGLVDRSWSGGGHMDHIPDHPWSGAPATGEAGTNHLAISLSTSPDSRVGDNADLVGSLELTDWPQGPRKSVKAHPAAGCHRLGTRTSSHRPH